MQDFPKFAAQVRGARALLGWSQAYLAEGVNVRRVIIADLESCKRKPHASTLSAVMTELSAAGIVFTEAGVALATGALCAIGVPNNKEAREEKGSSKGSAGHPGGLPLRIIR